MNETATATSAVAGTAGGGAAAVKPARTRAGKGSQVRAVPHVTPRVQLSAAARDALDYATADGRWIRLPDDMPDEVRGEVELGIRASGGHLRRGAYMFAGDAEPVLAALRGRRGKRKSNRGVRGFQPERLIDWRKSRGWEQKHLAELAGLSPGGLSHIESGKRLPSMDSLVKLTSALTIGNGTAAEPEYYTGMPVPDPDSEWASYMRPCYPEDLVVLTELAAAEPGMLQRLAADLAARETAARLQAGHGGRPRARAAAGAP